MAMVFQAPLKALCKQGQIETPTPDMILDATNTVELINSRVDFLVCCVVG